MNEWILLMNEWMKFIGTIGGKVDYDEKYTFWMDSDDDLQYLAFNKFMLKIQCSLESQFKRKCDVHPSPDLRYVVFFHTIEQIGSEERVKQLSDSWIHVLELSTLSPYSCVLFWLFPRWGRIISNRHSILSPDSPVPVSPLGRLTDGIKIADWSGPGLCHLSRTLNTSNFTSHIPFHFLLFQSKKVHKL